MAIQPDYWEAHNNLANALAARGQFDEAIVHYREALEIQPDSLGLRCNFGRALIGGGRLDEGLGQYRTALGLATARHESAMAEFIRTQIKLHASDSPGGSR